MIRESKYVSQLLHDNQASLEILMDQVKDTKRGMTLTCLNNFFPDLTAGGCDRLIITPRLIEESFIYSMMTVLNEPHDMKKYNSLCFVEFLEFICRVALTGVLGDHTVEYKLYVMLESIWSKMYACSKFNKKDHPLTPIDSGEFKCVV